MASWFVVIAAVVLVVAGLSLLLLVVVIVPTSYILVTIVCRDIYIYRAMFVAEHDKILNSFHCQNGDSKQKHGLWSSSEKTLFGLVGTIFGVDIFHSNNFMWFNSLLSEITAC